MRILRPVPALLVLLLLAACSDGTGPRALEGRWVQRHESNAVPPDWSRTELRFTFDGDGGYRWESITHASWGRPSDDLLGHAVTLGRYEVVDDSLFLTATRTEVWDYLTGSWEDDHGGPAGRFRFSISGRRLILDYVSYPLDAPEETRTVYRRD